MYKNSLISLVNFEIYGVATSLTSNYNTHIAQFLNK